MFGVGYGISKLGFESLRPSPKVKAPIISGAFLLALHKRANRHYLLLAYSPLILKT